MQFCKIANVCYQYTATDLHWFTSTEFHVAPLSAPILWTPRMRFDKFSLSVDTKGGLVYLIYKTDVQQFAYADVRITNGGHLVTQTHQYDDWGHAHEHGPVDPWQHAHELALMRPMIDADGGTYYGIDPHDVFGRHHRSIPDDEAKIIRAYARWKDVAIILGQYTNKDTIAILFQALHIIT